MHTSAENENERQLLLRLRLGDKDVFAVLYDRYKHRIAGNLIRLLRSDELAQDVLQDLFLKVWETRQDIDPAQSFRSYLFRIAQNMVHDIYRKAARDSRMQHQMIYMGSQMYSHIEENIISGENVAMVRQVISQLPAQQQRVFTLFKIEGMSYQQISEELGISHSTINKHIHAANKYLNEQFTGSSAFKTAAVATLILSGIL